MTPKTDEGHSLHRDTWTSPASSNLEDTPHKALTEPDSHFPMSNWLPTNPGLPDESPTDEMLAI
jgi:hypothetical protein